MKARIVWLILCGIWGSTWLFIKIGLNDRLFDEEVFRFRNSRHARIVVPAREPYSREEKKEDRIIT